VRIAALLVRSAVAVDPALDAKAEVAIRIAPGAGGGAHARHRTPAKRAASLPHVDAVPIQQTLDASTPGRVADAAIAGAIAVGQALDAGARRKIAPRWASPGARGVGRATRATLRNGVANGLVRRALVVRGARPPIRSARDEIAGHVAARREREEPNEDRKLRHRRVVTFDTIVPHPFMSSGVRGGSQIVKPGQVRIAWSRLPSLRAGGVRIVSLGRREEPFLQVRAERLLP
jgi:hypothetical protein